MTKPAAPPSETPHEAAYPPAFFEHHLKTLSGPMKQWQLQNRIPPVLLLTGQSGIGKKAMLHFLARWILCETCETQKLLKPCEHCPPCQRTLSGHEVNLIEITPETQEDAGTAPSTLKPSTLKIDQFRKLKATAGFHTEEGHPKVILIPNVEQMTPQAANSMLKLLEEPPAGWVFLMTTHDPTVLLPTLISRCQVLRLKPFSCQQVEALLQALGVEPEKGKTCARISQGSWARALQFADDQNWEKRKEVLQFLKNPAQNLSSLVDWSSQDHEHLTLLVDCLEQILSELISDLIFEKNIPNNIPESTPLTPAKNPAKHFWMTQAERLAQIRYELTLPLNRKLLAQDLLLPWLESESKRWLGAAGGQKSNPPSDQKGSFA